MAIKLVLKPVARKRIIIRRALGLLHARAAKGIEGISAQEYLKEYPKTDPALLDKVFQDILSGADVRDNIAAIEE